MRTSRFLALPILVSTTALLTSCASYQAKELASLHYASLREYPQTGGLSIGCKEFSEVDCKIYLDRNVIKKGYIPIQLSFDNRSDHPYVFMANQLSIPTVKASAVADEVHTSTLTRVLTYGIGGLVLTPLFIPAIVDGIMSSRANADLDKDFESKSQDYFVVHPRSYKTTLLFVPAKKLPSSFDLTLIEQDSNTLKTLTVRLE